MHRIILIRGPLGVGKTSVATLLADRIGAAYISIDRILEELALDNVEGKEIPVKNFHQANEHILPFIKEQIEHRDIIIDGNFYHKEQIEYFTSLFKENIHIFTLQASIETCIARDAGREKSYGESAARAVYSKVSPFDAGIVIDTNSKSAQKVADEIEKTLM